MTNEQLVIRIKAGIDVADNMAVLWEQNKGFIWKMAERFKGYEDREDLRQQGYIGLCDAVDGYRPEEGIPFINYAAFWIRQSMQRYIETCGSVLRLPSYVRQQARQYKRACADFQRSQGREPSEWEISRLLGISLEQVGKVRKVADMASTASLDSPAGEACEGMTIGDMVADETDVEGEILDQLQREQLQAVLWPLVDALPGDQPAAIRLRYQEKLTREEVGERIGCGQAQAQELERKGLRELRRPSNSRRLKPFLEDYITVHAYRGSGVETFNRTWTSSTEKTALGLLERPDVTNV